MFIKNTDGTVIYDTSSDLLTGTFFNSMTGQVISVKFEFFINLLKGIYNIGYNILKLNDNHSKEFLEYKNNAFVFSVLEKTSHQGIADLKAVCDIQFKNNP